MNMNLLSSSITSIGCGSLSLLQNLEKVLSGMFHYVLSTLLHNWPSLVLGMIIAILIKLYVDPERMRQMLMKNAKVSIPASVAFGAFTPFCACGTMAVIVAMMSTALPWGPVMAFLTSSPLMSPDQFILIAGIVGAPFAVALTVASVVIGLLSGAATTWIEKNTTWLRGQARFAEKQREGQSALGAGASCCSKSSEVRTPLPVMTFSQTSPGSGCGCSAAADIALHLDTPPASKAYSSKSKWQEAFKAFIDIGVKKILVLFSIFAGIGYLINTYVPQAWIVAAFDGHHPWAVPLAALVGLPLYVSGASSIPLIDTFIRAGASSGAMLAFMITGPGTSMGAMAGIMTIMKKKALALYLLFLYVGAVASGIVYDTIIQLKLF